VGGWERGRETARGSESLCAPVLAGLTVARVVVFVRVTVARRLHFAARVVLLDSHPVSHTSKETYYASKRVLIASKRALICKQKGRVVLLDSHPVSHTSKETYYASKRALICKQKGLHESFRGL